jgi:chromosome segregation ATPase
VANDLSEAKIKVQAREDRISELKRDMDTLKGENAALNSMVISLRGKIKEMETDLGGLETTASKSGYALNAIQRENKEYQSRILELESRIRTHMHEREEAERKTDVIYKKLDELANQVSSITGTQIPNTADGLEKLITKVS